MEKKKKTRTQGRRGQSTSAHPSSGAFVLRQIGRTHRVSVLVIEQPWIVRWWAHVPTLVASGTQGRRAHNARATRLPGIASESATFARDAIAGVGISGCPLPSATTRMDRPAGETFQTLRNARKEERSIANRGKTRRRHCRRGATRFVTTTSSASDKIRKGVIKVSSSSGTASRPGLGLHALNRSSSC